jgi:type IV secretory pathway TraG/TraD family ATPase VirD4
MAYDFGSVRSARTGGNAEIAGIESSDISQSRTQCIVQGGVPGVFKNGSLNRNQNKNRGVYTRTIFGTSVGDNPCPAATLNGRNKPFVTFQDTVTGNVFGLSKEQLSLGCLAISAPGGGKTNTFDMIFSELLASQGDQDIIICFDTKGDYWREFGQKIAPKDVVVIGNGSTYKHITSYPNCFAEVMPRGNDGRLVYVEDSDMKALELSHQLFQGMNSDIQPVFPAMSEQIFAGVMVYFMKTYWKSNPFMLNNRELVAFFRGMTNSDLIDIFSKAYMKDWRMCINYISGKNNQTQGVNSYLGSVLMKMFVGSFAQADTEREVSMMQELTQAKKKVIFIEYDLEMGNVLAPYYGILIDQALKYGLGGREEEGKRKNVYLLLDEMKLLPKLTHLGNALSFGRSQGVKVLAGLQNISSLKDIYGEAGAQDILAGFQNIFAFKITDYETRQFLTKRLGETYQNYSFSVQNDNTNVQRAGHTVEDWDIQELDMEKGRAIVALAGERPFLFHMPKYKE